MNTFNTEARARWGNTAAWGEFEQKMSGQSAEARQAAGDGLVAVLADIGQMSDQPADAPAVQAGVATLQAYITEHFYTCTNEILAGLGQMYAADPRFTETIDRVGGAGTAEFMSRAIEAFVKNKA
ncbi:MAG: TipAS antibiotic-recognition domain-containing protein [Clostridia bacterium]|nr:TipAS antibiotic-recognition domain-containing protein [Clostridia bacterium]